ncbi:hypothetical protein CEXT_471511 [Caerostris extrusa]|uniref:Uncharacterized protein n=1 Tax=Caerostris extrusa TaxID=172846 RepID=A0AAV4XLY2_CAEEX|nr:hypothetical protein CEXT_471511 [Caerostris extrusa]
MVDTEYCYGTPVSYSTKLEIDFLIHDAFPTQCDVRDSGRIIPLGIKKTHAQLLCFGILATQKRLAYVQKQSPRRNSGSSILDLDQRRV